MADTLTITSTITRTGSSNFSWTPNALTVTQAVVGGPTPGYVTIGTTVESISFGELTTPGFVCIQNLDATNYIRWGFTSGTYGARVRPGRYAIIELEPGTTLFLIANTAACKVNIYGFEA
jgi:hypothetical protein